MVAFVFCQVLEFGQLIRTFGSITCVRVVSAVCHLSVVCHLLKSGQTSTAGLERSLVRQLMYLNVSSDDSFVDISVIAVIPQTFVPKLSVSRTTLNVIVISFDDIVGQRIDGTSYHRIHAFVSMTGIARCGHFLYKLRDYRNEMTYTML